MSSWATMTLALVGLEEAHDVAQGDAFADAAAADDRHRLAGADVKVGIDQNRTVERLIDMPELDVMREGIILRHIPTSPREC